MTRQSMLLLSGVAALVLTGQAARAADPFAVVPSPANPEPMILVGTDPSGTVGVGVACQTGGPAAAYVCDGKTIGTWLSGSLAEDEDVMRLTSADGDTLSVDLSDEAAITGEGTISDKPMQFYLKFADRGWLLRYVRVVDEGREVSGWIATNDGSKFGLQKLIRNDGSGATVRRGVARRSNSVETDSAAPLPDDTVGSNGSDPPPSGQQPSPTLFRNCTRLLNRIENRQNNLIQQGRDVVSDRQINRMLEQSRKMGCCTIFDLQRDACFLEFLLAEP